MKDDALNVISSSRKIRQYSFHQKFPENGKSTGIDDGEILREKAEYNLIEECVAAYQSTSFWLKKKMLNK